MGIVRFVYNQFEDSRSSRFQWPVGQTYGSLIEYLASLARERLQKVGIG